MNNLDPDVAERPDDLVVYGGSGKAARNWPAFDAIVRSLRGSSTTRHSLVQSGKPVGVFRTHPWAPRVLIANAMLVPAWATWDNFRDLEHRGLTMYGQMTAGSWIYIGSQGIVQGTYETLAALARRHFGGSLCGRLVVTAGLGGMGGAQPLAVTMNGGVALVVEVDPPRIERRLATGYLDETADDLDEALASRRGWQREGVARSVALEGNAADVLPALVAPRRHARRRDRPDVGARCAERLRAERDALDEAVRAAADAARRTTSRGRWPPWPSTCARCSRFQRAVPSCSTTATTSARRRSTAGVDDAFDIPGFVPEYIRPLFCEGKGPFRWAALSGDPDDIA